MVGVICSSRAYLNDATPPLHLVQPHSTHLLHPWLGVIGRDEAPSEETGDVRS